MPDPSRILLVENDPADARLVVDIFGELVPRKVDLVPSGLKALDYLRSCARAADPLPAVMLLDLKMPKLDGFEVLERVRSDATLRLLPIVILSSSGHDRDLERAYSLGANGYVLKSIEFDRLREALAAIAKYWGEHNQPPPRGRSTPLSET